MNELTIDFIFIDTLYFIGQFDKPSEQHNLNPLI